MEDHISRLKDTIVGANAEVLADETVDKGESVDIDSDTKSNFSSNSNGNDKNQHNISDNNYIINDKDNNSNSKIADKDSTNNTNNNTTDTNESDDHMPRKPPPMPLPKSSVSDTFKSTDFQKGDLKRASEGDGNAKANASDGFGRNAAELQSVAFTSIDFQSLKNIGE
jgi:hypothetical protein